MPAFVHRIETALPEASYSQERALEFMQEHVATRPAVRRMLRSLYRNSGIERRHSVMGDWDGGAGDPLFLGPDGAIASPGTGARNAVYALEARRLFEELAHRLTADEARSVTHVITISCTGFFAPGPDYHVVRALGLPGSTERYHIGFMGCYAAFQGLKLARTICDADPTAVVLVLSVELCTLHMQFSEDTDDLIAGAIFADGASGALVSARPPAEGEVALELHSFRSELAPEGEDAMAWTIGDQGFRMKLSTYVPELLGSTMGPLLDRVLGEAGLDRDRIDWWAVHPGGRAILDRVQEAGTIPDHALAASREILRRCGNMSSATILFVLDELLRRGSAQADDRILAMAFGPGLTIETGLLSLRKGPSALPERVAPTLPERG